ncbi:MAG TPA: PEGA domain-containing protein [Terriglobia bacterium]|nr:PEGA domain-containing protein [Terriglobia bacterium]
MLSTLMFICTLFQQAQAVQPAAPAPPSPANAAAESATDLDAELLKVKRVYVDSFGDDAISKQLQSMVVNALNESKRFVVTENKDKADAILKGNALERTSQELHAIGEGTSVAGAAGSEHGSISGSVSGDTGSISGSHSGGFIAHALGESDSQASTETINDARLAVRLVVSNGDVVWTSTQESTGAKYKGASADVADKVVKQLVRDMDRMARQQTQAPADALKPQSSPAPTERPTAPSASVAVHSTPSGADITVDGWFVGNAPSTLKLPAGEHTISIAASGFKAWQRKIVVIVGSDVTLNATLEKQ